MKRGRGAKRIKSNRYIQTVREGGDLPRATIGAEVLEDHYAIAGGFVGRRRKRILAAGGRPEPAPGIDFAEADLAKRLRILRISNRQLRRWIQLWLAVLAGTFFTLWLVFNMLILAVLATIFLSAGPWYFVRRLAQTREQKKNNPNHRREKRIPTPATDRIGQIGMVLMVRSLIA